MPRYYLGVDGGGTNCRVRLANENLETLAEVRNGRSNLQIDDGDPAYAAVNAGTREVFEKAGVDFAETANTYACFGMAGGRLNSAREEFALRDWPFAKVRVYDDIDIAHAGALGGKDGAVIIVGTGSAGLAIIDGQRHQAGGWGFEIGDQMSGAILGRELVRIAVEAEDRLVEGSALTKAVIAKLGGNNDAVMDWSFDDNRNPADYGALMPMFIEHYQQGDAIAIKLMALQFSYIDAYADWFKARGAKVMAIVGGFGQALFPLLEKRYGDFVALPKFEPLHGALILSKQNFASA
ncbi:BadF/BadG/BcrA/BcrD ATPase family protein [Devosia rhodophyticola]|uniref:BadF/BadG/BcrA/BcrD ATPase family protein n=1 Tax=Devosia rhodophyticola TaxID=3026423 RepID=A0ABY7YZT6_9HYPH|nr:BadF/BadG/BcrA/BcrD ATPase family protein [Devosia rhodophyticola]WDR06583.1 BadF/BadG/BcrA/BcrD ATPase family protein [Devosia rhodophyticola]